MISWRIVSALSLILLNSACTNLQAVNTTSGQLVAAASSWNSVADEMEASCIRRNLVSDPASDCSNEKVATQHLEDANKILSAYFTALQQVSNGSNFTVDAKLTNLSKSVAAIPKLNSAQVQAVSGLGSFLANMATKAQEERTIKNLILAVPQAEDMMDVMNDVVVKELIRVYKDEATNTLATFNSYILQSGANIDLTKLDCKMGVSSKSFVNGTAYLLGQAYCAKNTALFTKISALNNYSNSLTTAKAALKSIESGKDDLTAQAIIQQLIAQATSLKTDIDAINKAF